MLILGINTTGDACETALVRDGAIVAERSEPMMQGHDARLAPLVDELMRTTSVAFAALDRIAVVVGPGSFTGIRVGVAFARGLSLSLDVPSVGVTSLEALDDRTMSKFSALRNRELMAQLSGISPVELKQCLNSNRYLSRPHTVRR